MPANSDWAGEWVAAKLREEKAVSAVDVISPTLLSIHRVAHGPAVVAVTAASSLDEGELINLSNQTPTPHFLVNASGDFVLTPKAFGRSEARGLPVGGMGDIKRALGLANISEYLNPEIEFVERGMRQHSRVTTFERMDERRYRVFRNAPLSPVVVMLINEYDLTAEHVRTARDRYGTFDRILVTNPNGRITDSAHEVALLMNVGVGHWRDFTRDLHK